MSIYAGKQLRVVKDNASVNERRSVYVNQPRDVTLATPTMRNINP